MTSQQHSLTQHLTRRQFLQAGTLTTSSLLLGSAASLSSLAAKPNNSPIVDTHMHIWANNYQKYPLRPGNAEPPCEGTAEMLIEEMDQHGVDHCVIVQVIYHGWDNSYVADIQQKYPDKFRTQGLINPTDPKVADKLSYWIEERGLHGMRISPIYYRDKDEWLTSKAHDELWRRAAKLDAVFNYFIHSSQLPTLEVMVKRHPDVRIAIDHFAYVDISADNAEEEFQKLLKLSKYPNVHCKVSEMRSPSASKVYPYEDMHPYTERLLERYGAERLMWGTGFPASSRDYFKVPSVEQELDIIRKHLTFLSEEDQRKILGLNAYHLWNFDKPA